MLYKTCQEIVQDKNCKVQAMSGKRTGWQLQSTKHVSKEDRMTIAKYKTCQERGQDDNCKVQAMSGKRTGWQLQSTKHVRKEDRMTIAKYKTCQERGQDDNCKVQAMSGKRTGWQLQSTKHVRKKDRMTIAKAQMTWTRVCLDRFRDRGDWPSTGLTALPRHEEANWRKQLWWAGHKVLARATWTPGKEILFLCTMNFYGNLESIRSFVYNVNCNS